VIVHNASKIVEEGDTSCHIACRTEIRMIDDKKLLNKLEKYAKFIKLTVFFFFRDTHYQLWLVWF
jgi:hypothetical protein